MTENNKSKQLTFAQQMILGKIAEKQANANSNNTGWAEYEEYYNDYKDNNFHSDYYDSAEEDAAAVARYKQQHPAEFIAGSTGKIEKLKRTLANWFKGRSK